MFDDEGTAMKTSPEASGRKGSSDAASSTAYSLLREEIVAGRFEPEAKLRVEELCERYKIGASPMREALSRLAETGLVVSEPNRGYWLAPVSVEEYQDLIAQRLALEPRALADAIRHGDIEWEAQVLAAHHRLSRAHAKLDGTEESFVAWAREDRAFHAATLSRCSSPWLLRFCALVSSQLSRYHRQRYLTGIKPGDQTEREHDALLKAILTRDVDLAVACLTKHITAVARRLVKDDLPSTG